MSDVIERLLAVEQEARRAIAQVEREAQEAVGRAGEEARRIRSEGAQEARRQAQELLDANARALQEEREKRIREEKDRVPSPDSIDGAKLEKAVQFAVGVIAYGEDRPR